MKRKNICAAAAVLLFLLALGLMLYPAAAERYNRCHQSEIRTEYDTAVSAEKENAVTEMLEDAENYNRMLCAAVPEEGTAVLPDSAVSEYEDQLDIAGNGIMGYLRIPTIGVELPIYHGTDDRTLEKGVGHLLGSSLPVGGTGTHAVLSGHSGMAGQKMFTDLENMETGDVFYIDILGETLAYEVKSISVVLPYDTSLLQIDPQRDLCTLVTCTPYGINTHRLLVQGERIPYDETETAENTVTAAKGSTWEKQYRKGILLGTVSAAAALGLLWVMRRPRRKKNA